MKEQDSELQERMLESGVFHQVSKLFEKISGKKEEEGRHLESYKFIILDLEQE